MAIKDNNGIAWPTIDMLLALVLIVLLTMSFAKPNLTQFLINQIHSDFQESLKTNFGVEIEEINDPINALFSPEQGLINTPGLFIKSFYQVSRLCKYEINNQSYLLYDPRENEVQLDAIRFIKNKKSEDGILEQLTAHDSDTLKNFMEYSYDIKKELAEKEIVDEQKEKNIRLKNKCAQAFNGQTCREQLVKIIIGGHSDRFLRNRKKPSHTEFNELIAVSRAEYFYSRLKHQEKLQLLDKLFVAAGFGCRDPIQNIDSGKNDFKDLLGFAQYCPENGINNEFKESINRRIEIRFFALPPIKSKKSNLQGAKT